MELIKSWIELVRDFSSVQIWWLIGVLVCAADWWLLVRFDTGLLDAVSLGNEFMLNQNINFLPETIYFLMFFAAIWLYLLPLVIVPSWKRLMFEFNYRTSSEYRNSPSLKEGWHLLRSIELRAAVEDNATLYSHCQLRREELMRRRYQLACSLGILAIGLTAPLLDAGTGNSLLGHAVQVFETLTAWRQVIVLFALMPGAILLLLIVGDKSDCFDPYICLPDLEQKKQNNRLVG
jgi:hypothetical protein